LKLFIQEEGKLGGRVTPTSYKDKCDKMDGENRIVFFFSFLNQGQIGTLDLVEHDQFFIFVRIFHLSFNGGSSKLQNKKKQQRSRMRRLPLQACHVVEILRESRQTFGWHGARRGLDAGTASCQCCEEIPSGASQPALDLHSS
jgi:hypothetical protein